jgi:hypothetical protein
MLYKWGVFAVPPDRQHLHIGGDQVEGPTISTQL